MTRIRGWPVTLREGAVGLRPLRLSDAKPLRETRLRNVEWLQPWEPTYPEMPLRTSRLAPYITLVQGIRREARQGLSMPWAITHENAFAGQLTISAMMWGSARSAQIGYWVDGARAGRGIAPTAVALAIDHAFFTVGLHRIEANIRPENQASKQVVEKLGFRAEGLRKRQLHIDGAWRDHICYALTTEDVPGGLLQRWRRRGSRPADDGSLPAEFRDNGS